MKGSVAALATVLIAGHAHAGMLGDTVRADYLYPNDTTVIFNQDVVVAGGVEIVNVPIMSTPSSLDFGDTSISFRQGPLPDIGQYTPGDFNGWLLSSLDLGAPIIGFNLTSFGIAGLDSSLVSFTSDSIKINLQGLFVEASNGWDLELLTRGTSVPEPGTLALVGFGLAVLGLSRRRRA